MDIRDDAMLMRKVSALRDGMRAGQLNPLWVSWMLQHVIEDNRRADLLLRPVFVTLERPSLSEIGALLERPYAGYQEGMDPELKELLGVMDWNAGPDQVDLTIVTMRNLFLEDGGERQKEGVIIDNAFHQDLFACPDWVVPALALYAEKTRPEIEKDYPHFNLCLTSDEKRLVWGPQGGGFGMFFKRRWHLYHRSVDRDSYWSSPINWLFVKPRLAA